jgi:hypothetical protein
VTRNPLATIIASKRGVIFLLGVVLNSLAIDTYAQNLFNSSDTSNVTVINKEWHFQVRNPALDESPFLDMEERFQLERDIRDNIQENKRRASLGLKPKKLPERPGVSKNDGPASAAYVYEVAVRNTGAKEIRELTLEYIFFEPITKKLLSRLLFLSEKNIAPGKSKTLVFRSAAPPTGTINAQNAGKKSREQYFEQVIIQSVKYADGSLWQASKQP